jgi:hypothetical protein
MPMRALVFWMPMPSYGFWGLKKKIGKFPE